MAAPLSGGAAGATVSGISGGRVIERSYGDGSARALERVNTSIAQPFRVGRGGNRRDDAPAAWTLAALGTRDDDLDARSVTLQALERRLGHDEEHREIVAIAADETRVR